MKLRSALLAATMLAAPLVVPVVAKAQPVTGIYVGAGAGYNILQDQTVKSLSSPAAVGTTGTLNLSNPKIQFNGGFAGLASVGWGFGNGLRVEVEGSYRQNKANKASGLFGLGTAAGGDEEKYGVMGNVLYDFNVGLPVIPYIGAGVGYQWAYWQNIRVYDNVGNRFNASDTQGSFAYQGIAGAAFPIPQIPGLSLTAEYRFMGLAETRKYSGTLTLPGIGSGTTKAKVQDDFNHSFLLGVRYNFGVAPPPPPPVVAPAPPAARSYLVFFDWDKYNLTDRAKQIIAEAAANIPKVQHTRIEVNGYADTSGTPAYNKALSIRRANAVAAELVRLGVAKQEIAIQGFGDTVLLVPTGPGVREPQNRRVEIIIR